MQRCIGPPLAKEAAATWFLKRWRNPCSPISSNWRGEWIRIPYRRCSESIPHSTPAVDSPETRIGFRLELAGFLPWPWCESCGTSQRGGRNRFQAQILRGLQANAHSGTSSAIGPGSVLAKIGTAPWPWLHHRRCRWLHGGAGTGGGSAGGIAGAGPYFAGRVEAAKTAARILTLAQTGSNDTGSGSD